MIWAIKEDNRVKATPKSVASCPLCKQEMIAKCGEIKIWHWSHKSKKECDNWYEPESKWHINWKNEFPKEQQEVRIGNHIADIKTKSGTIIELQNTPISLKEVKEREKFYGNKLIWLLNGDTFGKNLKLKTKLFEWKWMSSFVQQATKPIFVDMTNKSGWGIVKINLYDERFMHSDGEFRSYDKYEFLQIYGDIFKNIEADNEKQTNLL